jgi:predicted nucleic acid-binding Zn ribbon protein
VINSLKAFQEGEFRVSRGSPAGLAAGTLGSGDGLQEQRVQRPAGPAAGVLALTSFWQASPNTKHLGYMMQPSSLPDQELC